MANSPAGGTGPAGKMKAAFPNPKPKNQRRPNPVLPTNTTNAAAEPITRPMKEADATKLWNRYAELLRVEVRSKRLDNELFSIRQQLSITDRQHEIYQLAIAAEAPLADADAKLRQANQAMTDAHTESREADQKTREALNTITKRREAVMEKKLLADCAYSTALVNHQNLAGLRGCFWRLFNGQQPSGAPCTSGNRLPPEFSNAIVRLGVDPQRLDLPACK